MGDTAGAARTCGTYVPCAGVLGGGSALMVTMPCQRAPHDDDQHEIRMTTDEYEVVIVATTRREYP